ncbi:MAG: protein phosphatase CheZ [Candidatus Phaeomarinobacter sp.]
MADKESKAEAKLRIIRETLEAMSNSIATTRQEISALKDPEEANARVDEAAGELDQIVKATEGATSSILEAAEKMDDIAARVGALDGGSKAAMSESEAIGELTAEIFMACSFQDITGQRISKVVAVLKELEQRTSDLLGDYAPTKDTRPDAHLLNGPAAEGEGIDQDAVDAMFA